MSEDVVIRPYRDEDERGWVVCRVLSFLDSAFFDDVRQAKEHYEHPAIELVAERDREIVALIDVECDDVPGAVCSDRPGLGAMIWHLAVHPEHQRQSVATKLLREAERIGRARGLVRFEAWTRDDPGTQAWYESLGFMLVDSYLHVYVELHEGLRERFPISADGLRPVTLFAHYAGEDRDEMRRRFSRVHDDVLYKLRFA